MTAVPVERAKTGIIGLDDLLGGGLPKTRSILVTGEAGTGKSIFGSQFLYSGATKYNEPGVYVTLEESAERICENLRISFGWDFAKLIKEKKLAFIDACPYVLKATMEITFIPRIGSKEFSVHKLIDSIGEAVEKIKAQRIVVDSLSLLTFSRDNLFDIRRDILETVKTLGSLGVTSILVAESPQEGRIGRFGVEQFAAEGVIMLYYIRQGNTRVRALEILKMRGIAHSSDVVPFKITKDGIAVYPGERVFRE